MSRSVHVQAGGARQGFARGANARAAAAHLAADDRRASAAGQVRPPRSWITGAIGLLLVTGLVVAAVRFASDPLRFPVTNVDILGTLDYTDRGALSQRIEAEVGKGFYGLDIDAVRTSVEGLPWVDTARVSRVWPSRLTLDIAEHEPAARWNDDALVSKRLELFYPPQLSGSDPRGAEWRVVFAELPALRGSEGRQMDVFEDRRYYEAELASFGVSLVALEEDARRSQTLELSNGVTIRLGYEDRERRLARFIDVYERLVIPLEGQPARFDMRYSNGFALQTAGVQPASGGEVVNATTIREPG